MPSCTFCYIKIIVQVMEFLASLTLLSRGSIYIYIYIIYIYIYIYINKHAYVYRSIYIYTCLHALLLGDHRGKQNFLFLNSNALFRGELMNRLKFIMQQQWQDTINLFTVGSTNQVVDLLFTFC